MILTGKDKQAVTKFKQSEIGMSLVEFWKWITGDKSVGVDNLQGNANLHNSKRAFMQGGIQSKPKYRTHKLL